MVNLKNIRLRYKNDIAGAGQKKKVSNLTAKAVGIIRGKRASKMGSDEMEN
jgi:hypothetical protein